MTYAIALMTATALFCVIAWRDVRHGVFLVAVALPAYLLRFSIGPIPMTFLEVMILVVFSAWLFRMKPSPRTIVPKEWVLPMGLLSAAATIGVLVSPDRLAALGVWKAFYLEPMMLFAVTVDLIRRDAKTTDGLLTALASGGLFVAACAIVQGLTGAGIPIPWDVEGRVTSVFPYPNAVGLYLGPIVVLASILSLRGPVAKTISANGRWLWILTAVLGFLAIVLARSEAAVAAILGTLLVAGMATRRFRKQTAVIAVLATAIVLAVSPLRHYALEKLTFQDYSETVRLSQWSETIAMLKDHAAFGAGLSGYPIAMVPYHRATQFEIFQYPHTLLLNVWVELGALGIVAFGFLAERVFRTKESVAFFPLLAMFLHSLFDVPFFKNDLAAMTWIFLAVVAATAYAKNSRVRR